MNIEHAIREKINKFEAMPVICQQILTHMNDRNVEFGKLAEKIKYDPGMTANILKLANSAYFGAKHRVESLQSAIVRLGMKALFQIIVAQKTAGQMKGSLAGYALSPMELIKHAVWTAVGAEEFARVLGMRAPDLLFTAGLLHDIGKVILDPFVEHNRAQLLAAAREQELTFDQAEHKILALNHAEVGAELFRRWHFPAELETVVRLHHEPAAAAENYRAMATVVHLADMLAYSEGVGTGIDGLLYKVSGEATGSLGLKGRIIERVASQTLEKMNALENTLREIV